MSSPAAKTPLSIAILGTRGIPGRYGGFETFAEELSVRLVERGHQVAVYGRYPWVEVSQSSFRGVRTPVLPCIRTKYLETVTHASLSVVDALFKEFDVVLMCNAANAFLCWLPHLAGQRVVLNADGIERFRRKWGMAGRIFYRLGEFLATQFPDAVVSDARSIQRYYREEYAFRTHYIAYGAPARRLQSDSCVRELGLEPGDYVLFVSRLEPENNAHLVLEAFLESGLSIPLVIVGDAPYSRKYIAELRRRASFGNVLMPGAVYGEAYFELLSHCRCYVQATEVGGTHPALIEAMGAGCIVIANSTAENLEVVGDAGLVYPFNDVSELSRLMTEVCSDPGAYSDCSRKAVERVRKCYNWDSVVDRYEELFYDLAASEGR